ncbi:2-desacetyl-2-hydroxyethyl bacteriochlorophyllide A dehydrogenase [Pullulanibacillus pueri]|uniref:Galactitol-1-phosphate 5-dehydrogenase n=1 Tax=Pullulanibacillus pueri TaxID=1437324 RepID=A0A8J2ZTP7_9BACL|nr:alcohol dehydrogenase catalytic domain-containing protein [Pullulanibacillus pueri]MBM7681058.1 2-desacetyl-2-hydroxyethyl bacteriochlorophyllide A dehydrogenase [Pullulanibacillus pueri]GGH76877.1 galactitol-1-phosphate 5-dehydrogenase [Pullulanibacillus pueri]
MLAALFKPQEGFLLKDIPSEALKADEVRLKVEACGVCGSDRQVVRGEPAPPGTQFPLIMGHEISGTIIEIGQRNEEWQVGDQVIVFPFINCGSCKACKNNQSNLCYRQTCIGYHRSGGFAEEVIVPIAQIIRRPKSIDPASAALLVDAFATPYHAMRLSNIKASDSLLVIGTGGLGQAALRLRHGFDLESLAIVSRRKSSVEVPSDCELFTYSEGEIRQLTRKLRRWSGTGGIDVVLDTVGSSETVALAMDAVRPGGTVTVIGMSMDAVNIPIAKTVRRGLRLLTSFGSVKSDIVELLDLVENKKLDPKSLIAGTVSLKDVETPFSEQRASGRWIIQPHDGH